MATAIRPGDAAGRLHRVLTSAACALAVTAGPAVSHDARPQWYGIDNAVQARLVYGVPGGNDTALIFICDKGVPDLSVFVMRPLVAAAPGAHVSAGFGIGSERVTIAGVVQSTGIGDHTRIAGRMAWSPTFDAILASHGELVVTINRVEMHYELAGIETAARPVIALCSTAGRAIAAADLEVAVTNKTSRRVEQIALREPDDIELNTDGFGYDGLAPGGRHVFTVAGGAGVCTYEISVVFEDTDEGCCSDPIPIGQQDLCNDPRILIHD